MNVNKILLATTVAGIPAVFASGKTADKPAAPNADPAAPNAATGAADANAGETNVNEATKPAGGAGSKPRVEPVLTAVTTAVPMPTRESKRGSKSSYPFDSLTAVGASFGVKNKTAKQMASIVSNANRKAPQEPKRDAAGNIVYKTAEMKDANGTVIGRAPTQEPETVATRHYFAVDVDAKDDPDGASVRVFRDK